MSIWQHSRKDAWLVGVALLQGLGLWAAYRAHTSGHVAATAALAVGLVFLVCTNYQCVAHNFLHLPFFRPRALNVAFSIGNSLLIGVPQTLYKHHHLNHHRGNSDYPGTDGRTRDLSSIYRFSTVPRRAEPLWRYALLSPLRSDVQPLIATARAHGEGALAAAELAAMAAFVAVIVWASPAFAVQVYLPVWYFGQVAAYAENYVEHAGATPGHRQADSVSCYAGWYNRVWFNNGYHQEHHWRPQVHWTRVPELRDELPGPEHRRIVAHTHWLNWPTA